MRTLRSGKPLPDPPPVMRGSRGSGLLPSPIQQTLTYSLPTEEPSCIEFSATDTDTAPTISPPPEPSLGASAALHQSDKVTATEPQQPTDIGESQNDENFGDSDDKVISAPPLEAPIVTNGEESDIIAETQTPPETAAEEPQEEAEVITPIVKRGRGRPPKYPKTPTPTPFPLPTSTASQAQSEKKSDTPRGRGRPPLKKNKVMEEPSTLSQSTPGDKPEEDSENVEITPTANCEDTTQANDTKPELDGSLTCHETLELDDPGITKPLPLSLDELSQETQIIGENEETPKTEVKTVSDNNSLTIPILSATPTPELRRSSRCPKKKPATVVQATMAVERDAQPFNETCCHCGEEFTKKYLFLKHVKTHTNPTPTKKVAKVQTQLSPMSLKSSSSGSPQKPSTSSLQNRFNSGNDAASEGMAEDDQEDGDMDEYDEQQYEDYEERERNLVEGKPPIIPFTKKRPSLSSLTMKDPVFCTECGMTFTRRAHLNRHMMLHTGVKPFVCDICHLRFTRKDHMFAHKTKHEKDHKIQCAQCGIIFQTWKILQDHIEEVHSKFKRSATGASGSPRRIVVSRLPPTPAVNPNPDNCCETCGKKFLQRRYLRAHRKLHLKKEANIIDQLRRAESSYGDMYGNDVDMEIDENMLNPEVQIEDGERMDFNDDGVPIKTEPNSSNNVEKGDSPIPSRRFCRKSLASMNRVVRMAEERSNSEKSSEGGSHNSSVMSVEEADLDNDDLDEFIDYDYKAMMHLRSRKYKNTDANESGEDDDQEDVETMECSVCGETFSERSELRRHYRIHQKRFICRFCGLKLASAGSLMRHNLIHTGKKEFGCKLCDRRFSRKDTLAVHLQAHEKSSTRINMPKPFLCKLCSQGYTMKYNLVRHIKMCHGSMTVTDRATILKQIEQKYKHGIPSKEKVEDDEEIAESVKIKTEPLELDVDKDGVGNEEEIDRSTSSSPTEEELRQCEQDEIAKPLNDGDGDVSVGQFGCNHCGKFFKNAKSLNTHKWYHSRDKQFICPICSRGFKYSSDLGRHVQTHTNGAGSKGSSSNVSANVNRHHDQKHAAAGSSQNMQRSAISNSHPTQNFGRIQQNSQGTHISAPSGIVDTRPFSCKICPQRFNHRSNLSRHVRLIHKITSPIKRGVSINVQNYLMKINPSNPVLAKSQQSSSTSIRQPEQRLRPSLPVSSGTQQIKRTSWSGITMSGGVGLPQQLDKDGRRISVNGSSVLTPDSFTYDPTAERPYICNACGKTFETKSNLWTHSRIHNKIFGCDYCELKMATRGDLILHLRTHTGEKPFQCHLCEWKFSRKSGLNKHIEKYHGPGAKQLRTYKLNGPNPGTQQVQKQRPMNSSHMQMSNLAKISSVRSSSANSLLSRSRPGTLKSGNGLSITRTTVADPDSRYSCRLCTSIIIGKVNYVRHMNDHSKSSMVKAQGGQEKAKFLCKECGQEYGSQEMLTKHILTHSDSDAPRCTLCGKSCSSLAFLKSHYQYVHPNVPNPADQPTPSASFINGNNDGNLKPIVVRKVITDENGVEESDEEFPNESDEPPNMIQPGEFMDIDANNMDEDEIEYAPVNSRSSQYLRNSGEVVPPCNHCGKEFTNVLSRSDHVWYCRNANIINCPVMDCKLKLVSRRQIASHLRLHAEERNHSCRICTARFSHKTEAHRHMKVIHNFAVKSRAYPCDFCGTYGFLTELELRGHLETVHNVALEDVFGDIFGDEEEFQGEDEESNSYQRSYPEDEEGIPDPTSFLEQSMGVSSATLSSTANVTTKKNEQEQEYHCPLCNKQFATRQKWLYHRYYHIREEKYDCQDCDEKFKLRSHLERHIRTYHNEEKPVHNVLNCNQCPRKFTREYDLATHIQKVHDQIPRMIQQKRLSIPARILPIQPRPQLPPSEMRINSVSILKFSVANPARKQVLISNQPSTSISIATASKLVGNIVRKSWPPIGRGPPKVTTATTPTASSLIMKQRSEMQESTMTLGEDGWYTCNLCGKSFKEKKSIDAHRYYHNREEKHFCTHCGARFKQKSDLHRHVRIHHNSNNPKNTIHCPHCFRSFTDIRYMRMHIRRYHGGEAVGSGKEGGRIMSQNGGKGPNGQPSNDEIDSEEMDWDSAYMDEDDDDQKEMMTMEEMEYLQYQNDGEENSSNEGSGGSLQLTISCESCGTEIEMDKIAEHSCTGSAEEDEKTPSGSPSVSKITEQPPDIEPDTVKPPNEESDNDKQVEEISKIEISKEVEAPEQVEAPELEEVSPKEENPAHVDIPQQSEIPGKQEILPETTPILEESITEHVASLLNDERNN